MDVIDSSMALYWEPTDTTDSGSHLYVNRVCIVVFLTYKLVGGYHVVVTHSSELSTYALLLTFVGNQCKSVEETWIALKQQ